MAVDPAPERRCHAKVMFKVERSVADVEADHIDTSGAILLKLRQKGLVVGPHRQAGMIVPDQMVAKQVPGRYVRVYCTQRSNQYGDSLYELEVR